MSFERADTFSTSVLPGEPATEDQFSEVIKAFKSFILEFRINNRFLYRDQLRENILLHQYQLTVNSEHLISYNDELNKKLTDEPAEMIPLFEQAITDIAKRIAYISSDEVPSSFPICQLILLSNDMKISIRDLDSEHISKIVKISGIIISASTLRSKSTEVTIMCRNCRHTMKLKIPTSFGVPQIPNRCQAPPQPNGAKSECPPEPYIIVHDKSTFIDQQSLKLQETTDMVPVGEMPRHIILSVDRYLCNRVVPGVRCDIVGIYSIYQARVRNSSTTNNAAIRNPYMKVLGIQTEADAVTGGGFDGVFSEEEEEEFLAMSRLPDLYERFARSIAPSIYGNLDIKKAITCLLFGGSKKILPDSMRLRGDINALLLGDPGTAKSQLLKFVEKVAPIAIYTSGKGSSAAGLTASVQRDPNTRDFYLEGGAMVLADGGVVCIDEFDKMREEDRVAIHEAMEQQTISIAKAGITTVLNSRTSVLAAANPVFGRYDDMRSAGENIDFQTTILSRFDMIFIVKDQHNAQRDLSIAKHVMNVHTNGGSAEEQVEGEIPIEKMKRYIQYCRAKCAPRLSDDSAEMLSSHFVGLRKEVKEKEAYSSERSSIPITVRQLEAIVRISESLAKIELSPVAAERHVEEAIRLFNASTMQAINNGNADNAELTGQITRIEDEVKRRLPIGWSTSYSTLRRQFVDKGNYSQAALEKALTILERKESIQFRHQRMSVFRCGV
ncbi:minichromosome maintenance protein 5 [Brettanomyces nanus]|uniref:DNA replication licensing factor MCM5 n=1 Tax=Eeniella nana TaxID=13502 RepID=A0A875RXK8_EENNA|nr:minichromosome maintenance protein 5 [Brettanomyces nanus]QPG73378.1 minichromosome maintenance protein 5 [Brettanomyces nanus]